MKTILSFIIFLLMMQWTAAQDSWTIKLNNKLLLSTSKEDTIANTKKITSLEWRKSGFLEVNFKEDETISVWNRSFLFYDENDNELLARDSASHIKIALSTLRKLAAGKKKIIIYTIKSPKNPMMAVKMRRIYLCTLLLP